MVSARRADSSPDYTWAKGGHPRLWDEQGNASPGAATRPHGLAVPPGEA